MKDQTTATDKLNRIFDGVRGDIAEGQEHLEEWCEKFKMSPGYEMEWANGTVEIAARVEVYARVEASIIRLRENDEIDDAGILAHLEASAKREVLNGSCCPPQSTSPMSNLTNQYRVKAWATLYEKLSWA